MVPGFPLVFPSYAAMMSQGKVIRGRLPLLGRHRVPVQPGEVVVSPGVRGTEQVQ